jgi:uncharacterized protein (DUF924 family)
MPDNSSVDSCGEAVGALLDFWFDADPTDPQAVAAIKRRWFHSSAASDRELADRFGRLADEAAAGSLDALGESARGRLALIILLDQLPRNLHRGTAAAFAQDARALALCRSGMETRLPEALGALERLFFCMPLQHSESLEVQNLSVETFAHLATLDAPGPVAAALADFADYAVTHRDIVARFGRFPHRNAVLGRRSTDEEREFLQAGGPSFGQ